MSFRNPYHFVSVADTTADTIECPENQPLSNEILKHISFDRYHKNMLSGRLVCSVETIGPVIIGGEQNSSHNRHEQFFQSSTNTHTPDNLKNSFMVNISPEIAKAIKLIGQPDLKDINYPMAKDQQNPEDEGFKWFQNNDKSVSDIQRESQGLKPLEFETHGISRLKKN